MDTADVTIGVPTFRIFVSSTFKDFAAEREALQERVFPALRQVCLEMGCRFQAVDLRWGISEEAGHDQKTMEICLTEIARCQQVSPRPNFLVLLGDRYGWCPLPTTIPATEFQGIQAQTQNSDLLAQWYSRDDNAVPPVYELRPRKGEWRDPARWAVVEHKLREILVGAIEENRLAPERRVQYVASATEQEILRGALTVPDAAEHVFCFFRSIDGLPDDEQAASFVDLHQGRPDSGVRQRLQNLKANLEAHLPRNVFNYRERWTGNGISHDNLGKLCDEVEQRLRKVIETQMKTIVETDPLELEVNRHLRFGEERARHFRGRVDELECICEYLRGGDSRPLVLCGPYGSGKSALLGHIASQARSIVPSAEVVARFVGASPESSEPRALLEGLCRQTGRIYGEPDPASALLLGQLAEALGRRLTLVPPERPLVLILDGLDELAGPLARELGWLPRTLPNGVRLIVSTRSPAHLPFQISQSRGLTLGSLHLEEAEEILDVRLSEAGRTLSPEQRTAVSSSLSRNALPIYVRLVSEEVSRWKSYSPPVELPPTAEAIVRSDFARLAAEENHGAMLVARSLAILATAKNGLAEDEILDLLSTPDIMADFARRSPSSPHVPRLPPIAWARLQADLAPYVEERVADDAHLFTFRDEFLREIASVDYLLGDARVRFHRELAEYFRTHQLFVLSRGSRSLKANYRVLHELPWHLLRGDRDEELAELLTDFHFLDTAANAGCAGEVLPCLTELKSRVPLLDYFARALDRLRPGKRDHGVEFVGPSVVVVHDPIGAEALEARRINDVVIRYLRQLIEPRELIRFLERALEIAARISGSMVQALRNNLGTLLLDAGEIDRAKVYFAGATPEHGAWTYATSLHGQGIVALQHGDLDGAEDKLREALRLHESLRGARSSGMAADIAGLAAVAQARGRLTEARALCLQELSIVEKGLGTTHPRALDAHRRLAWILRQTGELDRAEYHYRWAISWGQVLLGNRHQQVQEDRLFLGTVLCCCRRFEEAWAVLKGIWDIDPQALGHSGPPSRASAFCGIASVLQGEKRNEEARSVLWHALETLDRDPEATDAQRVNCMEPLVALLVGEGRLGEAVPLLRRGLAYAVRQFGYDHEQAVSRRKRVRAAESALGKQDNAGKIECVFCGIENEPIVGDTMDAGEYDCPACGGALDWPSLLAQTLKELVPSSSPFVDQPGQWFRLRGLPFPFYARVQCKKCGYEATYYTRRTKTAPGSSCPKCGYCEEARSSTDSASAQRPYWEAWGTFQGPLSAWSVTCDRCGHVDTGDFHDRPEASCPKCGYNGS